MIAMVKPRRGHRNVPATRPRPPSGLSAMPASPVLASTPVAWYGRVATDEDADLMLTRQLGAAQRALPPEYTLMATFYDVGSGLLTPHQRGQRTDHVGVDLQLPRDGGLADLLAETQRPDRRFAAVVCESIERIARPTHLSRKIEYELEQAGVVLLVADEGIDRPANPTFDDSADTAGR